MLPNPQDPGSSSARKRRVRTSCRRPVGLTAYREKILKDKLRKSAPSEPWVEAQITTVVDKSPAGAQITYRYHDPHVFPPGGDKTKMIRCPECGILMPPLAFEHGKCLDHARHEGWGPSPSALAIRALQKLHGILEMKNMPPEDVECLRQEIRLFQMKKARKVKVDKKS